MDKSTGEPLLVDGKEVTAEKTFTAEKAEGTIGLEFTFDSSALEEKSVVVFERMYYEGIEIANHTDINDKNQTITFEIDKEGEATAEADHTPGSRASGGTVATGFEMNDNITKICTITLVVACAVFFILLRKKKKGGK